MSEKFQLRKIYPGYYRVTYKGTTYIVAKHKYEGWWYVNWVYDEDKELDEAYFQNRHRTKAEAVRDLKEDLEVT